MKTDKTVATEIAQQLGNGALCMLGASNLGCTDNRLCFKIGRNCKGVTHIKITLNSLDLYDMEFLRIRGPKITVLAEHNNIYNDMMHSIIEAETGLNTSL
jgi:hypothetical protein